MASWTKSHMSLEFDLIHRYFSHIGAPIVNEVILGVGDDAAMVSCAPDPMVIAVDTLVEGVHCYPDDPPDSWAQKALMVNLSDLSAMGAKPFGFLLSLTIPELDDAWLRAFAAALDAQASRAHVRLIGGDTTKGPRAVSITALGYVKDEHVLKRCNARVGDDIYVTGDIGAAAFYVYARSKGIEPGEHATRAYRYPEPRIDVGPHLCGLAHAAIDVSDGLLADLNHILTASQVGARLVQDNIPIAKEWFVCPPQEAFERAVTGGDDYVLCFTAPKTARALLTTLAEAIEVPMVMIGEVVEGSGILLDDKPWKGALGYDHFERHQHEAQP
ncbi:MAG: thiamine-phosphate kinase [Gammaproteobacteria bacterium]